VVGCSCRAAYQGDVIRGGGAVRVIVSRVTQERTTGEMPWWIADA
jgi:hypothetical protein